MKKNVINATFVLSFVVVAVVSGMKAYNATCQSEVDLILAENVEALSKDESGAKCPNGCRDIGWGWDKILECDCNYDHFSRCKSWGC